MKSEPIDFDSIGNLLICTRCGRLADGDAENDLKEHTIFYNGRVPVAILCDDCYMTLDEYGLLQEEQGKLVLYDDLTSVKPRAAGVSSDVPYTRRCYNRKTKI